MKTQHHVNETKAKRRNVVSHSEKSKGYRFKDKTPEMYVILYLMDKSPYTDTQFSVMTGLNLSTFRSWRTGKVLRPHPSSSRMILKKLEISPAYQDKDGNLIETGDFLKLFFKD